MKTLFKISLFLAMLLTLFLTTTVNLTSQTVIQDTASSVYIFNAIAGISLTSLFANISALAGAVLLITSLIKKYLNSNGTITIVISGTVSLALSALGYFAGLGIFSGISWVYILIYSTAAMLIANGLSTWSIISSVLEFFKLKVPKDK